MRDFEKGLGRCSEEVSTILKVECQQSKDIHKNVTLVKAIKTGPNRKYMLVFQRYRKSS
jgi:hypothetical protein